MALLYFVQQKSQVFNFFYPKAMDQLEYIDGSRSNLSLVIPNDMMFFHKVGGI